MVAPVESEDVDLYHLADEIISELQREGKTWSMDASVFYLDLLLQECEEGGYSSEEESEVDTSE